MTIEENKAIEDSKELIKDLKNNKDKDFIGRLYYKGKPVEENIEILVNLIEKLQKETIPTKYYACDPNKYIECKKKHCYINGGECDATIDETKVKYINLEDYIPKDKIRDRLLVVTDLKSKIDLSKKETPVEFYVLDYANNLLVELLEEK